MKRWLVQPITTDDAGQLVPIAPGFTRWTYRHARKLATLLNDYRHTDPEVWTLPPHRWLVIDRYQVAARARAEAHRLTPEDLAP